MADLYDSYDARKLLKNKTVIVIGDSNMRAIYKDIVWLLQETTLIDNDSLRKKMEKSYKGDKLVKSSVLSKSRDFFEERCYKKGDHFVKFYFITRCYCDVINNYLKEVRDGVVCKPDVIIMNSCLWDLTRWGPNGIEEYKDNMKKLMELFKSSLPSKTLFIWTTALPISISNLRGGLMIKQIEFMKSSLRYHILEANLFTRNLAKSFGFDVVDFHYHLNYQISRRSADGVHFLPLPVRLLTNLCLTHIALSWGRELPKKCDFMLIDDEIDLASGRPISINFNNNNNDAESQSIDRKALLPTPQPSGCSSAPYFQVVLPSGRLNTNAVYEAGATIYQSGTGGTTVPFRGTIVPSISSLEPLQPPPAPWQSQFYSQPQFTLQHSLFNYDESLLYNMNNYSRNHYSSNTLPQENSFDRVPWRNQRHHYSNNNGPNESKNNGPHKGQSNNTRHNDNSLNKQSQNKKSNSPQSKSQPQNNRPDQSEPSNSNDQSQGSKSNKPQPKQSNNKKRNRNNRKQPKRLQRPARKYNDNGWSRDGNAFRFGSFRFNFY